MTIEETTARLLAAPWWAGQTIELGGTPDLRSDAWGGVLLGMLGPAVEATWGLGGWSVRPHTCAPWSEAETLAHAAALALLEVRGG